MITKYKNYIVGAIAFIVFVGASIFGIAFCGVHSLMSIANQGNVLFSNLYQGIQSAFWLEVILLFAMLAIIGIIFALVLAKRANRLKM